MFKKSNFDFKTTGTLSTLVWDYLNKEEKLKTFYTHFPNKEGFSDLLHKKPYADFKRETLVETLLKQSALVNNTSESSTTNIQKLAQPHTYTVTTGHQLCLFTGPLYFIYKIFSTINLAENLNRLHPEKSFVPVYWMASEDHDFEEVNHLHISDKTLTWKSVQTGAVGDFKTEELNTVFAELKGLLGRSERADYLKELFEKAYLQHKTLAEATRFLVNELFGNYGVVTIDGNDATFKHQFKEEFKKDIFQHLHFQEVNKTLKELERQGYSGQVNPRPVNCFFMEQGLRVRIEKQGEEFILVGTKRSFTQKELEKIIDTTPEKISPNVVLRPLYQQAILPNVAYVGGPGELAYWLEFKQMFESANILFPVLMPRNFVTVVDKVSDSKIKKLGLSAAHFFKPEAEIIKELQRTKDIVFDLASEKNSISEFYSKILEKVSKNDITLSGSVSAELQRALNGFERIVGKTNRAIRRKYDTEIQQIKTIKQHLFPKNTPQERYENFSSLYLSYGADFLKVVKEQSNPFELEQIVFTEG